VKVVLVGGGRSAHNLIGLLEGAGWQIDYVLDDKPGPPVLGYSVRSLGAHTGPEWDALLSIGAPASRRAVVERRLSGGQFRWMRFTHPHAVVSRYADLGEGTLITPFVTIADAIIQPHVMVLPFTMLGARVRIGAFSVVSSHCCISSDVEIGEDCLIGAGAKIMAGVRIGNRCKIASNAVVRKDLADDSLYTPEGRQRTIRAD